MVSTFITVLLFIFSFGPLSYFGFPVQIPCLWADKRFDFLSLLAGIPVQPNPQNSYEDKGIRGCNPASSSTK